VAQPVRSYAGSVTDPAVAAQELRVAVGRVARRLRRISAEQDTANAVKFTQVVVLVRLARDGPLSPTAIARHEQVTSQAVAAVVRELEGKSLVTRDAHESDGRSTVVSITPAGRQALWDYEQAAVTALVQTLGDYYSAVEIRRLLAAVPLLNRLADVL
jgi:DNA-binding MarR family transcriptional regulator